MRWIGAGTIPGRFGHMYVTSPLVVLEISGERLRVNLRPKLLARVMGAEGLMAGADDISIFLLRSNAVWQGLEFRPPGAPSYYFWMNRIAGMRAEVVECLSSAGFQISDTGGQESWERPVEW